MTSPLIFYLLALVVPVFVGKTGSAPFWLAVQALALGAHSLAHSEALSLHALVSLFEVVVLRATLAPLLLRRAIASRGEPEADLLPSNLFTWGIATALIVLAFQFGAPALSDRQSLALGAVGATVAVALLLLSTNEAPAAQLVAVLFMENAIALFESLLAEPWPLPVHGALGAIYLLTAFVGSSLIGDPDSAGLDIDASAEGEAP